MQIIRIEDPENGFGVWRSCDSEYNHKVEFHSCFTEICKRHVRPQFPTLSQDIDLINQLNGEPREDYFFAFLSLEQLEVGFTRAELKELIVELGFRVYSIEANNILHSQFQAIFKKESVISKNDISFMFL